jgi:hypothetical protein
MRRGTSIGSVDADLPPLRYPLQPQLAERRRLVGRGLALALAFVASLAYPLAIGATAARASGGNLLAAEPPLDSTITAKQFVDLLRKGRLSENSHLTIAGRVELTPLHRVTQPLRCLGCTFKGGIEATDVAFTRLVVLSGSTIDGDLDFRGARFQDGFFLRTADLPQEPEVHADVRGKAHFSLATFDGDVGFDQTTFDRSLGFNGARFGGDVSFADTIVGGHASFALANFGADAIFTGSNSLCKENLPGTIEGNVNFRHALFSGSADFRNLCIRGGADFRTATFQGNANFLLARLGSNTSKMLVRWDADFTAASFQGSASFTATTFAGLVSFADVSASRALQFEGATFLNKVDCVRLAVSGLLSFKDAQLRGGIDLSHFTAGDLTFGLDSLPHVNGGRPEEERILGLIESSAKNRGDLALANEARYRNLSLQHADRHGFSRFVDGVFYGWAGGYLVKPLNPLWPFLILLVIGLLVRGSVRVHEHRLTVQRPRNRTLSTRRPALRLATWFSAYLEGLGDTVILAFEGKPKIGIKDRDRLRDYVLAAVRWVEYLWFKVLIAVFLLTLANSNSTLRDLIDSVRA